MALCGPGEAAASLTPQEVRAGRGCGVRPEQQPVEVVVLPLGEVAQAGVRVLLKRASGC